MDTILDIISYMLLFDSLGAVWIAFIGRKWFVHNFHAISRFFPPAKGWALLYFVLALFIVWLRNGGV